jgi:hypothetical protein
MAILPAVACEMQNVNPDTDGYSGARCADRRLVAGLLPDKNLG